MSLLLLNEDELRQVVTIHEAIDSIEVAFTALGKGQLDVPEDFALQLPKVKGEVQVHGAYFHDTPYYVIKVRSDFYNNLALNLPVHSGLTALFDAKTGFPVAIMVDNGYLSSIRSGAVGALAAKYLAGKPLDFVAVIGSDQQAYMQLKALMMIRPIGKVLVWSESPANADTYARQMVEDHNVDIEITSSIEAAVQPADLVILASYNQHPLLRAEWLKSGVHLTVVGQSYVTPQKLHAEVLKRADVIITDKLSQAGRSGEIHYALAAGAITYADIQGELSDLIVGNILGRTHPNQMTVADLTGLDLQDTVVATLALEKALFLGLGQQVESRL